MGSGPTRKDKFDGNVKYNNRDVELWCTEAVTAGDIICLDLGDTTYGLGKSCKKATSALAPLACGVARQTLTAAGWLRVRVRGYYATANVASSGGNAVTIGMGISISTTAGRAEKYGGQAPATDTYNTAQMITTLGYSKLGVAAATASANVGAVFLTDPLGLGED